MHYKKIIATPLGGTSCEWYFNYKGKFNMHFVSRPALIISVR